MFALYSLENGVINKIDTGDSGQELVMLALEHWHEDDSPMRLMYVLQNNSVWATLFCGENVERVTVCRTNGAAQHFTVRYLEDSTEIKSYEPSIGWTAIGVAMV